MAKAPKKPIPKKPKQKSSIGPKAAEPVTRDVEIIDTSEESEPRPGEFADSPFDVPEIEIDADADIDADLESLAATERARIIEAKSVDTKATKGRGKAKKAEPASITGTELVQSSTDPITTYLAEIRRYPLLTKEQERELAIRYRESGDAKAAEQLVTSNLRFVVKVAAEYSRFGAKLIDLVQEGNVGLMHAVKEYNPYKGVRLITYAVWWIRGYIQEYLMRQYSMVRIGTTQNQRKLFYRLQKEREALEASGSGSSVALLAGRLGVSEEEVETMTKRMSGRDVSLSQPLDSEGGGSSLLDFEASDDEAVDETLGHAEELSVLHEKIEAIRPELNAKELFILEKRILSEEPMTLQEIGDHYGTTREAVRQLEARLIGKIRAAMIE